MISSLLSLHHVSLKLPGMQSFILKNIDYEVNAGDFVIILGSNGSGKSSLLKLLDHRYHPTTGKILLNKKSLENYSSRELSQSVITLTQNTNESLFGSLTLLENYLLVKQRYESQLFSVTSKKERLFFADYLREFNANLPKKLDQIVDQLSGGEKQALALALAVLYPPKILLLDEHTSALDPKSGKQLMALTQKIISTHHITCILTTHDLDIAMHYGNRILALRHGEIYHAIENKDKKEITQQELLTACY